MLSRFPCGTSRLLRRQSDWLWSHAFEQISTCETTELEDCHGGEVHDQLVGCFQWEKGLHILIFPTSLL